MLLKSTDKEIDEFIKHHSRWIIKNRKLHREFKFENFIEAFEFMSQVAIAAENLNHHPEWFNIYNKVTIDLSTHETNAITERDFQLAILIDNLYQKI